MTQLFGWGTALGAALLSVLLGVIGAPADAGITKFDLEELADGETRTFGEGEGLITATRSGDVVTISLPGHGGSPRTLDCKLNDESNCFVYATDDSSAAKIVLLQAGEGGAGRNVEIVRLAHAHAEGGEPVKVMVEALGSFGEGEEPVFVTADSISADVDVLTGDVQVIRLGDDDMTTLRCPEGDTTMRLEKDDKIGSYFCPQHNVELKEVEHRARVRKVLVHTDGGHGELH